MCYLSLQLSGRHSTGHKVSSVLSRPEERGEGREKGENREWGRLDKLTMAIE